MSSIATMMHEMGKAAAAAAASLASVDTRCKVAALRGAAESIKSRKDEILLANQKDIEAGHSKGLTEAMLDRLSLDEERLDAIYTSLMTVADMKDPVGEVMAEWSRPNGLHIKRVRTPLGVVGVIFESRPNVMIDAGALCLKSGNASILRGGSDSWFSSKILHDCLIDGLQSASLPKTVIQRVPTKDRQAVGEMLRMYQYIDVIVPRGGKNLVSRVEEEARVPVFAHLEGICHVYIDADADVEKARRIVLNSKTRRCGICSAAECLLIDRKFYVKHGAPFILDLLAKGVEVRASGDLKELSGTVDSSPEDFGKEYLDMVIAAKLVDGVDGAVDHIREFGSQHTDAIITESSNTAGIFFRQLNSSVLMHNASTQFADGGEFGMGAEIGIATGKIHARGPVGAEQLTSFKYLVEGNGAIRP